MATTGVSFSWFFLSVYIITFLPGLLLVIAARRGKRIDDHPVCRGCGFDLVGTVEPIPGKHPKCPECGTRREPIIGNRQRRGRLASAGWLLMLASLGSAALWSYDRLGSAQLAPYKPLWMLRYEARAGTWHAADIALDEITTRWQSGNLTAAHGEILLDDAVAHGPAGNPALVTAPLGVKWDFLAAELIAAGHGSDADREAIGRSWFEFSVEVRPQIEEGGVIPLNLFRTLHGPPGGTALTLEVASPLLDYGSRRYPVNLPLHSGVVKQRTTGQGWIDIRSISLLPGVDAPADLPAGRHLMRVVQTVRILQTSSSQPAAEWDHVSEIDVKIVPIGGDPIALIDDPVAGRVVVESVDLLQDQINRVYPGHTLHFQHVAHALTYTVSLRHGNQTWPFDTLIALPGGGDWGYRLSTDVPDEIPDGAIVDLVFESDPDVARGTTGLTEILDHRFVIEGVEVVRTVRP